MTSVIPQKRTAVTNGLTKDLLDGSEDSGVFLLVPR